MISGSSDIVERDVHLSFNADWRIDALCKVLANWMSDTSPAPAKISCAGIISSLSFERTLENTLDKDLVKNLRLLVQISTILHNHGLRATYVGYSSIDLWSIRSYAGSRVF